MTQILGYKIFSGAKLELLNSIINRADKVNIVSGNPEVLYNAIKDNYLYSSFTGDNTIIIPDGAGVVLTSKLLKTPVEEKIAGIEFMDEIIKYCSENGEGIFLLGAEQTSLESCVNQLLEKYPLLKICGMQNGFFDIEACDSLIEKINSTAPYALFVAMGSPKQEKFIIKYMEKITAKVFMGVGGSFDVIGGKINRAPEWMIKINLEWLYRVSKEPWRIKRLNSIPKFMYMAMREHRNIKESK